MLVSLYEPIDFTGFSLGSSSNFESFWNSQIINYAKKDLSVSIISAHVNTQLYLSSYQCPLIRFFFHIIKVKKKVQDNFLIMSVRYWRGTEMQKGRRILSGARRQSNI